MKAYVLITVPALRSGGLVEILRKTEGVEEAYAVYGETDIVAKIKVPDKKALDDLIMDKIQRLPWVQTTRTYIIIDSI